MKTFGTWKVTTEGDVEGRSTRQLGTYVGHIDDIAFHLADKQYYSLEFTKVNEPIEGPFIPKRNRVNVTINGFSDNGKVNMQDISWLFKDRDVKVNPNNYYASFELETNQVIDKKAIIRAKAMEKLTEEEKEALGLRLVK